MEERIDVVCVGILVADILTSTIDRIPQPGELIWSHEISLSGGGHAHNTSVSLARLGMKVGAVGKIGNDPFGKFLVEDLQREGVDTSRITVSNTSGTSKTMILLTPFEDRRFIHTIGANGDFGVDDVDFDYLQNVKILYVGGCGVLPKLDGEPLVKVLRFAKEHDLTTVLDVVISHLELDWKSKFERVLGLTDFFLPNNDEAAIITGQKSPKKQAEKILEYNPEMTVVITMGKDGSLVRTKDRIIQASSYEMEIADPSGGGDAFTAGFIFGLAHDWELTETLKLASAMGASAVRKRGCTAGVFTREEANKFIGMSEIKISRLLLK